MMGKHDASQKVISGTFVKVSHNPNGTIDVFLDRATGFMHEKFIGRPRCLKTS